MRRKVYFGSRGRMEWVTAPTINMDRGLVGWSVKSQRIGGTSGVRRGSAPHREYNIEWPLRDTAEIDFIQSVLNGDHGYWFQSSGDPEPDINYYGIFFLDPFALNANVLPDWWASPIRSVGGRRLLPSLATVEAHPNQSDSGPVQGVKFASGTSETSQTWMAPIPPGHTLHFGMQGVGSGLRTRVHGSVSYTPVNLIDPSSSDLTNFTRTNPTGDVRWQEFSISAASPITLFRGYASIRPDGQPAPSGPWGTGQGSGALLVEGDVQRVGYSAALNYEALTVRLVEVAQ